LGKAIWRSGAALCFQQDGRSTQIP
jgi:hypothetical protein